MRATMPQTRNLPHILLIETVFIFKIMKKYTLIFLLFAQICHAQMPFVLDTVVFYPYEKMYAGTSYAQSLRVDTTKLGHFKFTLMPPQYDSAKTELWPAYNYFVVKKGAKPQPSQPNEIVRIVPPIYKVLTKKQHLSNSTFLLQLPIYDVCVSDDARFYVRYAIVERPSDFVPYQTHVLIDSAKIVRRVGKKEVIEILDSTSPFLEAVRVPPQYAMSKKHDFRKQRYRLEADFDFRPYLSEWRHISCCETRNTSPTVADIQKALQVRGYNVRINDVMDRKTKAALTRFQRDKGLPVGNLNVDTMKSLGL
jgi:hypothetical protein